MVIARKPAARTRADRVVVTYSHKAPEVAGHDSCTREEISRRLAALMNLAYEGEYEPRRRYAVAPYFVPGDTLTTQTASRLGIRDEDDLFGGVVAHPYMATKTITHPLVDAHCKAPRGWSDAFARLVARVVLDGFSAFTRDDAARAGSKLLESGGVRVKRAAGIAGLGQYMVDNATALADTLAAIDGDEIARSGIVIEQNLSDSRTFSVGQVRAGGLVGTYCGTQRLTTNHRGADVYGGSDLVVVRGDFDALLDRRWPEDARLAIAQARVYDQAARQSFPGFFASRRNYDVLQGTDDAGRHHSGVLEQSWRLGGASSAEIGALQAFAADPGLGVVRAISREVYGEAPVLPADAVVCFAGVDPRIGPLTKYAWTEPHADAR
jgi:hypothetical protein